MPRPTARSDWVTTRAMLWPAAMKVSSVGGRRIQTCGKRRASSSSPQTALLYLFASKASVTESKSVHPGVAKLASGGPIRHEVLPLAGFLHLADLTQGEFAFETADTVDEENAVEVVDLVEHGAG
jgi:hypothetical protein